MKDFKYIDLIEYYNTFFSIPVLFKVLVLGILLNMDFLESDTPKSPIRLKFNAHFASYIFPELIPQR